MVMEEDPNQREAQLLQDPRQGALIVSLTHCYTCMSVGSFDMDLIFSHCILVFSIHALQRLNILPFM